MGRSSPEDSSVTGVQHDPESAQRQLNQTIRLRKIINMFGGVDEYSLAMRLQHMDFSAIGETEGGGEREGGERGGGWT